MTAVLIYDISSNRVRAKVADACLDYGLSRIQYSAFFGEISANHLEELLQRIRRLAGCGDLRLEVFPVCAKDLKLRRTLVQHRLKGEGPSETPSGPRLLPGASNQHRLKGEGPSETGPRGTSRPKSRRGEAARSPRAPDLTPDTGTADDPDPFEDDGDAAQEGA